MAVVLGVLIWLTWYYNSEIISSTVRWIRYGEMWVVSWFVSDEYTVNYNGNDVNWKIGFEDTPRFPSAVITPSHLSYFSSLAMQPWRPVLTIIFLLSAVWIMFRGPGTQYRTKLDLEGLIRRQAANFPMIAPFMDFNPSKQPPRPPGSPVPAELPPFAEALAPEEWLAYNTIPIVDAKIDQDAAKKAFMKQLGERWRGAHHLQPYQQVLLAAFCLKASRKRNEADDLLGELSLCWSHEKGFSAAKSKKIVQEARKILRTRDLAEKTLQQANNHGFVTTALMRALQFAREEGGVLAPAQFVWLRAHDRLLWYPLNNLGRQSFHMEALGAMTHFKAERLTGRPIPVAQMDGAVKTIVEYMDSDRARPVPPLEYSESDKSGIRKAV